MIHFAGHLDDRPNHCIECRQAFSSRHDFVQHLRVHVLKPSKYHLQQCDVCGEVSQGGGFCLVGCIGCFLLRFFFFFG